MREELRTIAYNKQERSVIRRNLRKKIEKNVAAFAVIKNEAKKVVTSAHRLQLLEQEEKIHLLQMEKTDVQGEKDIKNREIEGQAGKIRELEALLKEQYLLLKCT